MDMRQFFHIKKNSHLLDLHVVTIFFNFLENNFVQKPNFFFNQVVFVFKNFFDADSALFYYDEALL